MLYLSESSRVHLKYYNEKYQYVYVAIFRELFTLIWLIWSRNFASSLLMTYMCFIKSTIIGSDSVLSPGRCQTIIWNDDGMLLIGPLRTNSEILFEIHTFSFKKIYFKISSGKGRPLCLCLYGLNEHNKFGLENTHYWLFCLLKFGELLWATGTQNKSQITLMHLICIS